MSSPKPEVVFDLLKNSSLYREYLAEREEILRHKWIESEKAGKDIGFERALLDWIIKFRSEWRNLRAKAVAEAGGSGKVREEKASVGN